MIRFTLALTALATACTAQPARAADLYDRLDRINHAVNRLPLTDCKAQAFEKLRRLHRAGIAGRFVVVRTETGGYHAIAVVDGWALDSRRHRVVTVEGLRKDGYSIAETVK